MVRRGELAGLPGVFLVYEFTPFMVERTEKAVPFSHFMTSVCAIIGGVFERGQMGSAPRGSLQFSCFFGGGTFWVLPLAYFYLPKSARAYLLPQSVEVRYYFCSGPASVDPICPQPNAPRIKMISITVVSTSIR